MTADASALSQSARPGIGDAPLVVKYTVVVPRAPDGVAICTPAVAASRAAAGASVAMMTCAAGSISPPASTTPVTRPSYTVSACTPTSVRTEPAGSCAANCFVRAPMPAAGTTVSPSASVLKVNSSTDALVASVRSNKMPP